MYTAVEKVRVITTDGCVYTARLLAYDSKTNLTLEDVNEIVMATPEELKSGEAETELVYKGVQVFRGENVVIVGLVDEVVEGSVDWSKVAGELGTTKH